LDILEIDVANRIDNSSVGKYPIGQREEVVGKIKTKAGLEANFVYHMLSVARCGYDNDYGKEFRGLHPKADLDILKSNEKSITVAGGEHCGELYWHFVSIPASLDSPAVDYYRSLGDLFRSGDAEKNARAYPDFYFSFLPGDEGMITKAVKNTLEKYAHLGREIVAMSGAMERNYEIYRLNVWEKTQTVLATYCSGVQALFDKDDVDERLEALIGAQLEGTFTASFCNSVNGGAEAIDISKDQDIFGIGRSYEQAKNFICHEFVVYILKGLLFGETFPDFSLWKRFEALAEFYLGLAGLEVRMFAEEMKEIIAFYREERDRNPNATAVELFRASGQV